MHVLTSNLTDEIGCCPEADAPAVAGVGSCANPVLPVPPLLVGDLPEAARPPRQLPALPVGVVDQLGANTMRPVVNALVVAVSGTFPWAS